MLSRSLILVSLALLAIPLWAQDEVAKPAPAKPKPAVCRCPKVPANWTLHACKLNWVSRAKVVSLKTITIGKAKYTQYTLQHVKILSDDKTLPTTLIVPTGACALTLREGQDYLLGGLMAGKAQLYTTKCLSGDPRKPNSKTAPLWSSLSAAERKTIDPLHCDPKGTTLASRGPFKIPKVTPKPVVPK